MINGNLFFQTSLERRESKNFTIYPETEDGGIKIIVIRREFITLIPSNPIYKPLVEVNMNIMVEKALSNKNLFEVLQYVRWANAYPFYINRRESVKNLFISYIYLGEFKRAKELLIEKKEIMGLEQYKKLGRLLGEYK